MAGNAAFGTLLKIGGTAGTAVVNVTSIEGPGMSTEFADVTAHDSASRFAEYAPTFQDGGEVTLRINYDPNQATHKNAAGGLMKLYVDRTSSSFAITFPTSPVASIVFTAYVSAVSPTAPYDGKLEADVTLRITGAPTLP